MAILIAFLTSASNFDSDIAALIMDDIVSARLRRTDAHRGNPEPL